MSRISPGYVTNDESSLAKIIKNSLRLKKAFFWHLSNMVINVRQLAAKAFVAFTHPNDLTKEMEMIVNLLVTKSMKTNLQNGLLLTAKEIVREVKIEHQLVVKDSDILFKCIDELKPLLNKICITNRILILDIADCLDIPVLDIIDTNDENLKQYEPNFYSWTIRQNRPNCDPKLTMMKRFQDVKHDPKTISQFLKENIHNTDMPTSLVEDSNELLLKQEHLIESDVANNLISVCGHVLQNDRFGLSTKTGCIVTYCLAITRGGQISDDQLKKVSEEILKYSDPRNVETSRMNAAKAISYW